VRGLRESLSGLPLILRCAVVGSVCAGTIASILVVVGAVRNYSWDDVAQAALFGVVEAFVLAGSAGALLGLVVGLFAYLVRAAKRHL
jgi:hypothetical protein